MSSFILRICNVRPPSSGFILYCNYPKISTAHKNRFFFSFFFLFFWHFCVKVKKKPAVSSSHYFFYLAAKQINSSTVKLIKYTLCVSCEWGKFHTQFILAAKNIPNLVGHHLWNHADYPTHVVDTRSHSQFGSPTHPWFPSTVRVPLKRYAFWGVLLWTGVAPLSIV